MLVHWMVATLPGIVLALSGASGVGMPSSLTLVESEPVRLESLVTHTMTAFAPSSSCEPSTSDWVEPGAS